MGNARHLARKAGSLSALAFFLLPVVVANAQTCIEPDKLSATHVERSFTQEKHFPGMSNPLVSQGEMRASEREIIWHMTKPFDVKTIITPDAITQSIDNGPVEKLDQGAAGGSVAMAKSMGALMRGQWSELNSFFNVTTQGASKENDWRVTLVPHDDRLAKALGTISIEGCDDVETVTIARSADDFEKIAFSKNMSASQAVLP